MSNLKYCEKKNKNMFAKIYEFPKSVMAAGEENIGFNFLENLHQICNLNKSHLKFQQNPSQRVGLNTNFISAQIDFSLVTCPSGLRISIFGKHYPGEAIPTLGWMVPVLSPVS